MIASVKEIRAGRRVSKPYNGQANKKRNGMDIARDRDLLGLVIVGIITSYSWESSTFAVMGASRYNIVKA